MAGLLRGVAVAAAACLVLAGCSGGDSGPSGESTPATSASDPAASPPPAPEVGECRRLSYDEAIAATDESDPVACGERHTARTFHVGRVDTLVDGHLLAVDSEKVQGRIAEACPRRLRQFLGASEEEVRLSMFRAVWFSPTLEESDAGARWFRCDVVALAGTDRLLPLAGKLPGALDSARGRNRYGMCGTANPESEDFQRVACARRHGWRAIDVVDIDARRWPGRERVRSVGQEPCEAAAEEAADDPLQFTWSYEWPTRDQWREGTRHGLCWVPTG